MRVLLSSTWGHGHVFPMVPLAKALLAAGHQVRWATNEPACGLVAAAGIATTASGLDAAGVAATEHRLRSASAALLPQDRAAFAFPNMFGSWVAPAMARDLLAVAQAWRPDVMVHESAELAAPLVAALLDVPLVTHSFGSAVPVPFLARAGELLAGLWQEHGRDVTPYAGCFTGGYLDLCPPSVQGQSLEHISTRIPVRPMGYTGEPQGLVLPEDPRPLVYLTLGTVHNKPAPLKAAVEALAGLGARVLVTVGRNGDPAALGAPGEHVQVERWVCQSEVLQQAAVVVSHGGSGTFLGALAEGLPQVFLPQAADQFRNAAAGLAAGAGLALHPDDATPQAVAGAVERVLHEEAFRLAAGTVAAEIAAMPAPEQIVPTLERLRP